MPAYQIRVYTEEMDAMWKTLAVAMFVLAQYADGPQFVTVWTAADGHSRGVPKASVDKYAIEHGISFQEACRQIGLEIAAQK
jgi:hypothetical protein